MDCLYLNSIGGNLEEESDTQNLKMETKTQTLMNPFVNNHLRKSKTANALLGLAVLLNGNKREYVTGIAANSYFGFKVRNDMDE